ncbi:MAG TPA: CsbD family protein [Vicinamibacterales bacterium]|jgi:uncharacterized protein YjbJ (UPF0337 family)
MHNQDEIKGKMERARGKAKERIGDMTGDEKLRGEGEADEIGGNARKTFGEGRRKVGEALDDLGDKLKR